MNQKKYMLAIIVIAINGCSNNKSTIQKTERELKPKINITEVTCNNTKIQIDKLKLKTNKEETKLFLPVVIDNSKSTTRNDIIFKSIAFFSGGGDLGQTMPFKPYGARVNPKEIINKKIEFSLPKTPMPNHLSVGNTNNIDIMQVSINYECKNINGHIERKRSRF